MSKEKKDDRLNYEDVSVFMNIRDGIDIFLGGDENLPGLMADMEELGMELVTIHDRPMKTELGEYYYLVECEGGSYESFRKLTEKSAFEFRYLGSFDVR